MCVRRVPTDSQLIAHVRLCASGHEVRPVAECDLFAVVGDVRVELRPAVLPHQFGATAIVGEKQHQRVVVLAQAPQRLEHATDL